MSVERSDDTTLTCEGRTQEQTDTEGNGRAWSKTLVVQRHVHIWHDGQRSHASPRHQAKERSWDDTTHPCDGLLLHENAARREFPNNIRRSNSLHCGKRRQTPEHHEQRCAEEGNRRNIDKWESDKIHRSARIPRITLKSDKEPAIIAFRSRVAEMFSHREQDARVTVMNHSHCRWLSMQGAFCPDVKRVVTEKTPFERLHGKNPTQESFHLA